jgi:hypothetical protein
MSWLITGSEKTPVDPQFTSVSLLLHGNGANGSTTIVDSSSSPKTVTAVGNAQISTAQSKFGGASIAFDGNGDYLNITPGTDFAFGTGDYTVECWLYIGSQTSSGFVFDFRNGSSSHMACYYTGTNSPLYFYSNNGGRITSANWPTGVWTHFALSRSGTTAKMFLDGSQTGSSYTDAHSYGSPSTVRIGTSDTTGAFFNGYIDDLRITKYARYTANFTPPTAPFPDI